MDAVLLLIVAASGLSAVSSHVRRQYHVVSDRKNMTEAQRYCREKYTDLATIDNMEDMKILIDTADKSNVSKKGVWIGLYDDVNSWRWSLSDTSFYKDGGTEFRQWWPGEPNNGGSRDHCTVMYDGRWDDSDCETRFQSVCMDVRGPNVTFVFINTPMTWTEAQSYCREHHTDLASVRNTAENQEVKDVMTSGRAWIGLFRDSWKWSDGSNSSFRYWAQGQPDGGNQDCVVADLSRDGKWWDDLCSWKLPFVCYSLLPTTTRQVFKVRLQRKDSSLDLNDPAVMEQMLKEFKQRLKDQGVDGDVKLSWRKQADGKVFHKEEETKKKRKKDEF